jgi:hypothetical protein
LDFGQGIIPYVGWPYVGNLGSFWEIEECKDTLERHLGVKVVYEGFQ